MALGAEILDRRRAEMSLRELTGRLLRSQDEERRHMARELHDHAGQTLIALGFNLSALHEATATGLRKSPSWWMRAISCRMTYRKKFGRCHTFCILRFLMNLDWSTPCAGT